MTLRWRNLTYGIPEYGEATMKWLIFVPLNRVTEVSKLTLANFPLIENSYLPFYRYPSRFERILTTSDKLFSAAAPQAPDILSGTQTGSPVLMSSSGKLSVDAAGATHAITTAPPTPPPAQHSLHCRCRRCRCWKLTHGRGGDGTLRSPACLPR